MAKEIELNIKIGKDGKIIASPKGTEGKECLDIMKFLDKLKSFNILETTPNEDMKESNRKIIESNINVRKD